MSVLLIGGAAIIIYSVANAKAKKTVAEQLAAQVAAEKAAAEKAAAEAKAAAVKKAAADAAARKKAADAAAAKKAKEDALKNPTWMKNPVDIYATDIGKPVAFKSAGWYILSNGPLGPSMMNSASAFTFNAHGQVRMGTVVDVGVASTSPLKLISTRYVKVKVDNTALSGLNGKTVWIEQQQVLLAEL